MGTLDFATTHNRGDAPATTVDSTVEKGKRRRVASEKESEELARRKAFHKLLCGAAVHPPYYAHEFSRP